MGDENYGFDRGLIQDICLGFSVPEQLCDVRLLSVNYFFVKSSKSGGHLGFLKHLKMLRVQSWDEREIYLLRFSQTCEL